MVLVTPPLPIEPMLLRGTGRIEQLDTVARKLVNNVWLLPSGTDGKFMRLLGNYKHQVYPIVLSNYICLNERIFQVSEKQDFFQ